MWLWSCLDSLSRFCIDLTRLCSWTIPEKPVETWRGGAMCCDPLKTHHYPIRAQRHGTDSTQYRHYSWSKSLAHDQLTAQIAPPSLAQLRFLWATGQTASVYLYQQGIRIPGSWAPLLPQFAFTHKQPSGHYSYVLFKWIDQIWVYTHPLITPLVHSAKQPSLAFIDFQWPAFSV